MINPIFLKFAGLEIRYYGILMALAFLTGYFIVKKLRKEFELSEEHVENLFVYFLISAIVGARIFEILFYDLNYYYKNPIKIFYLWEGGLASHGAVIGMFLVALYYSKKHKIPFYNITDLFVIPIALGSAFVRLGNFINQELVGKITTLFWGIKFDKYEGLRHPIQLYQIFSNLVLFGILFNIRKIKNRKPGLIFWTFMILFSIFRFFIEFFRDLPAGYGHYLFGLNVAQIMSLIIFLISICPFYKRIE